MASYIRAKDLRIRYAISGGTVEAVRGISFEVGEGEAVGLVGQSGSGKSSVAATVLGLLPETASSSGSICLDDIDLISLTDREMEDIRGKEIGMVFQDPYSALNPVFPVRTTLLDTIRRHTPDVGRPEARRMAVEALEALGLEERHLGSYPHQLSGGMRQRVLIAATMLAEPRFLIADEPTSDLDVISQRQILQILRDLQRSRQLGLLLISHDLGVVHAACDRIVVLKDGVIVEEGSTDVILSRPTHPYTQSLIRLSRRDKTHAGRLFVPSDIPDD